MIIYKNNMDHITLLVAVLTGVHFVFSCIQFLALTRLLCLEQSFQHQKLQNTVDHIRREQLLEVHEHIRKAYVQHFNEHQKWFQAYLFAFLLVLYHLINDVYTLFYRLSFEDVSEVSPATILFYIVSMTFRTYDKFSRVPSLTNIALMHGESAIHSRHSPISEHTVVLSNDWKAVRYGLFFASANLFILVPVLLSATMYYLASGECQGYFICVYSWDHWFSMLNTLGFTYYFFTDYFHYKSYLSWVSVTLLIGLAMIQLLIPFVAHSMIIPLTITVSLYYELLLVMASHHFLACHKNLNGENEQ